MNGLLIDSLVLDDGPPLRAAVAQGGWVRLAHPDPDLVLDALAGLRPSAGGIVVGGREVGALAPAARVRAGLHVVTGRVPELPEVTVLDLLLLSCRPAGARAVLRSLVGLRGGRDPEEEAAARAFAGRVGLADWVGRAAVGLPPGVALLADAARALLAGPRAVVLRAPEDLGADDRAPDEPAPDVRAAGPPAVGAADVRDALADAQSRAGFPVLEVGRAVGSQA